jgi:hypothetical protein
MALAKLEQPARLTASGRMPFGTFVKPIRAASTTPKDNGIPLFIDPAGLGEAGVGIRDPVNRPRRPARLGATLSEALRPLGLGYYVRDGLLTINSRRAADRAVREAPKVTRRP